MTDDLISRRAAIDVVHHTIYEFFDVVEDDDESPLTYKDTKLLELNKSISTRVKDLPSAQKWIQVTERLPEENKPVLVTHHGKYQAFVSVDWIDPYTHEWNRTCNVTAWQPIPAPWKGGENGEVH